MQPRPSPKPRSYGATKDSLFDRSGFDDGDLEVASMDQRQKVLYGNQKLDETSERIMRAQQTSAKSEEIGAEIIGALEEDREVLERAKRKLGTVNENMDETRWVVLGLARRMVTNKIILIFIILLLLASIAVIIYLKWLKKYIGPN